MRLQVFHETHYTYNTPIHAVAMEARLKPCNDDYQFCQRYRLTVSPKATIEEYTTFADALVHHWTILRTTDVHVVSESIVDIHDRPLMPVIAPPIAIDPIDFYPYLSATPLTKCAANVKSFAAQFQSLAAEDWYQTALAIQTTIHSSIEFKVDCTSTLTTADDVLQLGCGVCQDFTHLMLAALRCLGIPARYVSGYLNQDLNQAPIHAGGVSYQSMSQSLGYQNMESSAIILGENSVRGTGASHAWCEVYLGAEAGWRGFDPANNLLIDQNYVRIGAGRDFNDVTPVKGVHKGPAEEQLKVVVSVSQVG